MTRWSGLLCPSDPEHGPLIPLVEPTASGEAWYCPHRVHDGRGETPRTRPYFTTAQAEAATRTGKRA